MYEPDVKSLDWFSKWKSNLNFAIEIEIKFLEIWKKQRKKERKLTDRAVDLVEMIGRGRGRLVDKNRRDSFGRVG